MPRLFGETPKSPQEAIHVDLLFRDWGAMDLARNLVGDRGRDRDCQIATATLGLISSPLSGCRAQWWEISVLSQCQVDDVIIPPTLQSAISPSFADSRRLSVRLSAACVCLLVALALWGGTVDVERG